MKIFYLLFLVTEILSTNPEMEKENKNILISIYENLFLKYPKVDVKPEDFINHLSPDSENYKEAWISITLTVIFGLLVYIIPIYLTERDHIGPYPLWLHNFFLQLILWVFGSFLKHIKNIIIFYLLFYLLVKVSGF